MDKSNDTEKFGWSSFPLGTVIDKISTNDKKIKQKEYLIEGKYPVIDQGADFIGGYSNDSSKVLICDLPVIVFGDHTKILKLVRYHFVPGADGVKVLLPHKSILPELFVFFVQILLRNIPDKGYARHFQHLEKSEIPIPPLPEQRAIVAKIEQLFNELDNGIACLEKAQEQLKVYRQAILKKAFEGELTKAWREQQTSLPSAQELLETIKTERAQTAKLQGKKLKQVIQLTQTELDDLPKLPNGWRWVKYDEIGYWTGGGTPSKNNITYWQDGDVLWASPKDMKVKTIFNTIDKITPLSILQSSAKLIQANSILFVVRSGIIRRTLPISIAGKELTVNQDLQSLTLYSGNFNFIYWYSISNEQLIRSICAKDGTTVDSLEVTKLKNFPVSFCSPQEQSQIVQEIETRLSVCDNMEATIKESLEKAEALRQSILKKAFEGKLLSLEELQITRNAPDWEPAEKLLERIRAEKRIAR